MGRLSLGGGGAHSAPFGRCFSYPNAPRPLRQTRNDVVGLEHADTQEIKSKLVELEREAEAGSAEA
ncbi:MAG: hypothetical protein E5X38_29745, partial [Mesorhizobium sp.]